MTPLLSKRLGIVRLLNLCSFVSLLNSSATFLVNPSIEVENVGSVLVGEHLKSESLTM